MRRHDKAGGTPAKAQRRKMLRRRNTVKVARRRKSSTADGTDRIALLTIERDEALERQKARSEVLKAISSSRGAPEPVFKAGMLMLHSSDGSFDTRVMVGAPSALVDALLYQSFTPPPGVPLDRRPSPVPSSVGLVVKKGLNIFALTSGEMPMPLSRIRISTVSPKFLVVALRTGSKVSRFRLERLPGGAATLESAALSRRKRRLELLIESSS